MKTMQTKIAALLLALLLACGMVTPVAAASGGTTAVSAFTDITDPAVAAAVSVLEAFGVVSGYGDGRFGPNDRLTRAQFAKMAIMLMGLED